jgi:hypothetical protein
MYFKTPVRHGFTPVKSSHYLKKNRQEITSTGKDVEKREPSYIAGENVISTAIVENNMQVPKEIKNRVIMTQQSHYKDI